jgi:hypothetical protein
MMGIDPATMQWTFTQDGTEWGPNVQLVLVLGNTYTFNSNDSAIINAAHIFWFTTDACGDHDIPDNLATVVSDRMTITIQPSMKTRDYWYACKTHPCMTSLTPITFELPLHVPTGRYELNSTKFLTIIDNTQIRYGNSGMEIYSYDNTTGIVAITSGNPVSDGSFDMNDNFTLGVNGNTYKLIGNGINGGTYEQPPVNCVGEWQSVGGCSINDVQTEQFVITTPASNGGTCEAISGQTREVPC